MTLDTILDEYNTDRKKLEALKPYIERKDYLYFKQELLDTLNSIGRVKESIIIKAMKQIINVLEQEINQQHLDKYNKQMDLRKREQTVEWFKKEY